MKFHRNSITPAKPLPFSFEPDFSSFDFKPHYPLLGLNKIEAEGEVRVEEKRLWVRLSIKGIATVSDSRTLAPFEMELHYDDEFALLQNVDDDADGYLFEENEIDLAEVVFCSIHTHIPMCPHAPDSAMPSSGEGYSVLTEEEFASEPKPSPFDVLKDLDVDE